MHTFDVYLRLLACSTRGKWVGCDSLGACGEEGEVGYAVEFGAERSFHSKGARQGSVKHVGDAAGGIGAEE